VDAKDNFAQGHQLGYCKLVSGPSSACKAALEALADVYRTELKPFGVDFVVIQPGNMRTKAPAKSAAAIKRMRERLIPEHRQTNNETEK
jgi:NAD(P)-dependent dehydrogenase (short-subunit alcohol dehydrogenase family)